MARDILAIPAASPGIERVFNIARDVCNFRRSALAPDTIRAEMIKYCYDHKESEEVESSRLSSLEKEYSETTTQEEIEQDIQQRIDAVAAAMEHSYISEDEFDDMEEDSPGHQNYRRRSKPQRR